MTHIVLTHAGAGSYRTDTDGPEHAARRALQMMLDGDTPLSAAVEAVALLEDDPRFNAGTGSNLRFDGVTVEMDAACMDSNGRFGAVAAIQDVKNPVRIAREILRTPHSLVAGEGALHFARSLGYGPHDARTALARQRHRTLMEGMRASNFQADAHGWDLRELRALWNYDVPLEQLLGTLDTVGAVATDGEGFAAALSTGGVIATLMGRVGDVPLPGCGLWAGEAGAVAATGDGDRLARAVFATRVYRWLEDGMDPEKAVERAIGMFDDKVEVGLVVVTRHGWAGGSNRDMAWAVAREGAP